MWVPDFGNYHIRGGVVLKDVQTIGWLDSEHPFTIGGVQLMLRRKLAQILKRETVHLMRHMVYCPLCPAHTPFLLDGKAAAFWEVWIPSKDSCFAYASPNTILHSIENHGYLPPKEYLDAVEEFDLESAWSGEAFRKMKVNEAFS